nr:MAG TPA_asm: hypothetical protein [Caudoviricetes sp.]
MLCIPSASPRTGCLLCGAFSFVNVHFLKVPVLFMWASHRYRGRTKLRRVIVGTECRNRGFIEERQFKKSSLDIARRKMRRHPRRALVCVIQSRNRRVVYIHEVVRNPPPVPQCAPSLYHDFPRQFFLCHCGGPSSPSNGRGSIITPAHAKERHAMRHTAISTRARMIPPPRSSAAKLHCAVPAQKLRTANI